MRRWYDVEGPTWLVAATIYAGWIALAIWHRSLPLAIVLPLAVYLTAWHASLQHETIHALRRVPRPMRTLVAIVPLGIWFPYEWYRREHLRHHATRDIAGSNDPESFYHDGATWAKMSAPLRALYLLNATFAGRLILGPAIQIVRTYAGEIRRLRSGDRTYVRVWCAHSPVPCYGCSRIAAYTRSPTSRSSHIRPHRSRSCARSPSTATRKIHKNERRSSKAAARFRYSSSTTTSTRSITGTPACRGSNFRKRIAANASEARTRPVRRRYGGIGRSHADGCCTRSTSPLWARPGSRSQRNDRVESEPFSNVCG